jgi:hypothetical protein
VLSRLTDLNAIDQGNTQDNKNSHSQKRDCG